MTENLYLQVIKKYWWIHTRKLILGQVICLKLNQACNTIFGHTFYDNFWPNGLKYFIGTQEIIIYRLVIRNHNDDAYFQFLIFLDHLAGKWAWSLQTKIEKSAHWVDLWANYYLGIMLSNRLPSSPLKVKVNQRTFQLLKCALWSRRLLTKLPMEFIK